MVVIIGKIVVERMADGLVDGKAGLVKGVAGHLYPLQQLLHADSKLLWDRDWDWVS